MSRILIWLRTFTAPVGALWLLVTFTPVDRWWAHELAQPWNDCRGEILVVLGGNSLPDHVLGNSSYWRAVYTVRAMRNHPFREVILSGEGTSQLMLDFVRSQGIDTSNVHLEAASLSTRENAMQVAPMLAGKRGQVVLLTSDYHVWRAVRVFRKAGVETAACPAVDSLKRYSNWEFRAGIFIELATETAKIAWYRWKGWI